MLASSYCLRKASTSNHQSVYITSAPGLVNLKISISNLTGASCFFSLLLLQPLHLCRWPVVSLTVEYPSESGALCPERKEVSPPAHHHALGLRWSSTQSCGPCTGGKPSFGHPFHCRGSPSLLGCTSNQLH